jgi:hypothetical protein
MQTSQGSVLESLQAVQTFLTDNADKLGAVVKTGARQKLDDAIVELTTHAEEQQGSHLAAQGNTQEKRSLQLVLRRDHMAPIARIARADLPPTPAVEPLKMPKGRPTAARLAALADGMANAATPFADTFISAGLPTDFIAQLRAATTAMVASVAERNQNRGKRGGATTGLKQKLGRARRIVHVLDAFIQTALKDDQALLSSWNIVKRVRRNTNRPATPATPPVTPPVTPLKDEQSLIFEPLQAGRPDLLPGYERVV